ncbi:hypothetical protein [Fontivita pretiosa]|uniref:hypothetical protein n=1 Tax=Fontivita pretiosa TaxID=2989684 RepID=UPI003D176742
MQRTEEEFDRLVKRIEFLEARAPRNKNRSILTILVGLGVVCTLAGTQGGWFVDAEGRAKTQSDILRAQTIQVVSPQGQVLMELGSRANLAYWILKDREGATRATFGLGRVASDDQGVTLWLHDLEGDNRLVVRGPSKHRDPEILLKQGGAEMTLTVVGGTPLIRMVDKDNRQVWKAP